MDSNMKSILLLAALITGIGLIVISIIGLSVVGQVAYFILAVIDSSLWTDQYRYVDGNSSGSETPQYTAAKEQMGDDLSNVTLALAAAAIVIGLIGLVIVILVFFMKGGILDMIKGTRATDM